MKTVMFICKRCILQVIHDKRNISGRKKKHSQIKSFDTGGVGGIRSLRRRGRLRWGCHVPAAPPASPCSSHLRTRSPAAPSYFWSGSRGDRNVGLGPHWWFETFTHRHGGDTHLLQIQDSGLYPGHLHLLIHLVDVAFDQTHGQSFHHQQLHLQDNTRHCFSPSKSILDHWWKTFDIHEHWPRSRGPWCSERSLWRSTVCGWKDEWKSSVGERTSLSLCSWVTVLTYTEFLTLVIRKMLTILLKSWNRVTMQNVSCFLCVCVYSHLHDTQQLDFLHQFRLMGCEVRL